MTMIGHPWIFGLFVLLLMALISRKGRYFIRRSTLIPFMKAKRNYRGRVSLKKTLPYFFFTSAIVLLILAAADISLGTKKSFKRYVTHNYVLIDDGSGSMTANSQNEVKGLSEAVKSVVAGNKSFLESLARIKRKDKSNDRVGLVVFSSDAYVVSYPTTDYDGVSKRLDLIDWFGSPLAAGTSLENALWVSIQMIIQRNGGVGGAYYQAGELDSLEVRLRGGAEDLKLTKSLISKTKRIAQEIKGVSFIVFTDGEFFLFGDWLWFSTKKLLQLCEKLGIRVYIISTKSIQSNAEIAIRKTGGRVEFIRHLNDVEKLKRVYREIANQQANEYVVEDKKEKRSLYLKFGIPGFCLLFVWLLIKNTVSRSLTSV